MQSPMWQNLRSQRLRIDGFKCQRCGSYDRLQVHHLRYDLNFGMENPYTDLVTLCEKCHEEIEKEKRMHREEVKAYWESQRDRWEKEKEERIASHKHHQDLIRQFIEEHRSDDTSNVGKGKKNYCNLDVLKSVFYPWMRAHGAEEFDDGYIPGTAQVQEYFRNRKYEVILYLMLQGLSEWQIQKKTGFTSSMIHKVCANPEQATALLNKESEENKHV